MDTTIKRGKTSEMSDCVMGVVVVGGFFVCYMNLNCQFMHFHPERIQLINYVLFV